MKNNTKKLLDTVIMRGLSICKEQSNKKAKTENEEFIKVAQIVVASIILEPTIEYMSNSKELKMQENAKIIRNLITQFKKNGIILEKNNNKVSDEENNNTD